MNHSLTRCFGRVSRLILGSAGAGDPWKSAPESVQIVKLPSRVTLALLGVQGLGGLR